MRRSQWPRGLRHGSAAARLLRLRVRIPPGAWMSVCCECCVLSGRDMCDELITRPEESHRLWCVVVSDIETSSKRRPWPTGGCCAKNIQIQHANSSLPYRHCHLWHIWLFRNFPRYLTKSKTFRKKILHTKCVFSFSSQMWYENFPILRIIQRHVIINVFI